MRRICIFTGTRAEYGLLRPLIRALQETGSIEVRLLVTGAHLSATHGATWREIEADGLTIDERVEIVLDADGKAAVCTSMGLGVMRFGEALQRIGADALVVLGDRYEAFAVAAAATVCGIPIAHLHGGELTMGAVDEAFRHAITKMSHLHFTSTESYRQRVIQLGENPDTVFNVGALGVENAISLALLDQACVRQRLELHQGQRYLLVTFHPATLDSTAPEQQLEELLGALGQFPDHVAVFTGANADAGGGKLNRMLADQGTRHPQRFRFFPSLGLHLYLSSVRFAEAVVGNSSSGIIEVPSFGVPTVDIGLRQAGRIRSASVLHCDSERDAITRTLATALTPDFREQAKRVKNPYEKAGTSSAIAQKLATASLKPLLQKRFFDLPLDNKTGQ